MNHSTVCSFLALAFLLSGCFLRAEFNLPEGPVNSTLDLVDAPEGDEVQPEQAVAIVETGGLRVIRIGDTGPGAADFITGARPHNFSPDQPNYAIRFLGRKDNTGSFNPTVYISFEDEQGDKAGEIALIGNTYPFENPDSIGTSSWNTYYIELNTNTSTWKYWISGETGVYESEVMPFENKRFDLLDRMRVDILSDVPNASPGCKNNVFHVFFEIDYLAIFPSDEAFVPVL